MSPELPQVIVTYVVPALIMGYLELRRRRLQSKEHAVDAAQTRRKTDYEMGMSLRDELWERWQSVNDENTRLRMRLDVLEKRVDVLTELAVRHGLSLPDWAEDAG